MLNGGCAGKPCLTGANVPSAEAGVTALQVLYNDEGRDGSSVHKQMVAQCCFDPSRGHLCVAVKAEGGVLGCFAPGKQPSPRCGVLISESAGLAVCSVRLWMMAGCRCTPCS